MTKLAKKPFFNVGGELLVCFFLVLATAVVYFQVAEFDFINFDTDQYVYANSFVKQGLTANNINWAFRTLHFSNWHPLTWLSHMLDVELFGLVPGRHHLVNVLFHIVNTLLLFGVLRKMTGTTWRSGLVAALFALHPLHVESVAWIAERKDLLSTFFGLLAIWSYKYYGMRPGIGRYLPVMLFFSLSLMAKPMMVTLPFGLLLLDYWPLGRIQFETLEKANGFARQITSQGSLSSLIVEKIPLFLLSAASCMVTLYAQNIGGAMTSLTLHPLHFRIKNALVAYAVYIRKMLWPDNLSIFYPLPNMFPIWQVIASCLLLSTITFFALRFIKSRPWFLVGWLWYLGTLVPVIGLVQVGGQAMADRYTYIPLIGLFIIIAWGLWDLPTHRKFYKLTLPAFGFTLVGVFTAVSWNQVGYWRNSTTVFKRALEVMENNWVAHNNLGMALAASGRHREADVHFAEALKLNPKKFAHDYVDKGVELLRQGKTDAAVSRFLRALELNNGFAEAHNHLGLAFIRQGKLDEAIGHFQLAVKFKPNYEDARRNLNLASTIHQKLNRAVANMDEAIDFVAIDPKLDSGLEDLLKRKKELDQVIGKFNKSLSLQPGFNKLHHEDIPIVAETKRRYENALPLFMEASRLRPDCANAYYHIACIYARQGRIMESIESLDQAIQNGFSERDTIESDSDLENIRAYESYQLLVKG